MGPRAGWPPRVASKTIWNSSELDTSIWTCSHWSRKCPPRCHTASCPWVLLRSTLNSPLSESREQAGQAPGRHLCAQPGPLVPYTQGPVTHRNAQESPCSTRSGGRRLQLLAVAHCAARLPGPQDLARWFQRKRSGLLLCPQCGPLKAGGTGMEWLHCSSPSCTHPDQAKAGGSTHTGQIQSHRTLQGIGR